MFGKVKLSLYLTKHHDMKAYWGSGGEEYKSWSSSLGNFHSHLSHAYT
jgi:hypothetical protein